MQCALSTFLSPSHAHTNLHLILCLSLSFVLLLTLSDLFSLSFQIRLRDVAAELNVLFGATRSSLGFFQVKTNDEKMKKTWQKTAEEEEEQKKKPKTIFILQLSYILYIHVYRAGFSLIVFYSFP